MDLKPQLFEFYGKECPHCAEMEPVVERLKDEEEVEILKLEVWHNEKNAALMHQYDRDQCGSVPFFYNSHTGRWLCGIIKYEKLKEWAMGK